jgi:hypothetical protein
MGMVERGDLSNRSAGASVISSSTPYMKLSICQLLIWVGVGGCCVSISIDVLGVEERISRGQSSSKKLALFIPI